jgi:hypothetical protein
MILLKITPSQYQLLKNHPIHYELDFKFSEKDQCYELECEGKVATEVKKIVDN